MLKLKVANKTYKQVPSLETSKKHQNKALIAIKFSHYKLDL